MTHFLQDGNPYLPTLFKDMHCMSAILSSPLLSFPFLSLSLSLFSPFVLDRARNSFQDIQNYAKIPPSLNKLQLPFPALTPLRSINRTR